MMHGTTNNKRWTLRVSRQWRLNIKTNKATVICHTSIFFPKYNFQNCHPDFSQYPELFRRSVYSLALLTGVNPISVNKMYCCVGYHDTSIPADSSFHTVCSAQTVRLSSLSLHPPWQRGFERCCGPFR